MMKKRLISLILAGAMVLGMAGCAKNRENQMTRKVTKEDMNLR